MVRHGGIADRLLDEDHVDDLLLDVVLEHHGRDLIEREPDDRAEHRRVRHGHVPRDDRLDVRSGRDLERDAVITVRRRGAAIATVGIMMLTGCSRAPHRDWDAEHEGPIPQIDQQTFTSRYQPVVTAVTTATVQNGFTWQSGTPTVTTTSKNGICSWHISKQGTLPTGTPLRTIRTDVNRVLVQNGFRAAAWDRDSDDEIMSSLDEHRALLEITLTDHAAIDVYSPAAGQTCAPPSSASPTTP